MLQVTFGVFVSPQLYINVISLTVRAHICFSLCIECVSNVDETLGEMFLEEKTLTEDDIRVCCHHKLCLMSHVHLVNEMLAEIGRFTLRIDCIVRQITFCNTSISLTVSYTFLYSKVCLLHLSNLCKLFD